MYVQREVICNRIQHVARRRRPIRNGFRQNNPSFSPSSRTSTDPVIVEIRARAALQSKIQKHDRQYIPGNKQTDRQTNLTMEAYTTTRYEEVFRLLVKTASVHFLLTSKAVNEARLLHTHAVGRVRFQYNKNEKYGEKKCRAQNTPPTPQQHGDHGRLETAYDEIFFSSF